MLPPYGEAPLELLVKGVTLENDDQAAFPDAPSERAVKHVEELMSARQEGYEAYVLFFHPRLLQHDFGNPYMIGRRTLTPGQNPSARLLMIVR